MATKPPKFLSPARSLQQDSVIFISSSPELPSLNDILAKPPKKDPLRSGSNALPIPADATASFMTAARLYQSSISKENTSIDMGKDPQVSGSPRRRGRPPAKKAATNTIITQLPAADESIEEEPQPPSEIRQKGRKRKVKEPLAKEVSASPEKPWLKFKGSPEAAGDEKLLGGQEEIKVVKKAPRKKTETLSRHFQSKTGKADEAQDPPASPAPEVVELEEPAELEPAMKRRTDWTPSKNTIYHLLSDSSDFHEIVSPSAANALPDGKRSEVFKNLAGTYGCNLDELHQNSIPSASTKADVLGKRKLVEAVVTSDVRAAPAPEESPIKSKAPKKKARTITELATSAYRIPEESQTPNSLTSHQSISDTSNTVGTAGAAKGKGKGARKPAKPRATKKKAEPPRMLLLSPSSAMKQASKQDILFGTSSQLAMEDDPALLRALHTAMQASNTDPDNPFITSSPPDSDLWARSRNQSKLWKAGARDIDGTLLEVIDLANTSPAASEAPLRTGPEALASAPPASSPITQEETMSGDDKFLDLTDTPAIIKSFDILAQLAAADGKHKDDLSSVPSGLAPGMNSKAVSGRGGTIGIKSALPQEVMVLTDSPAAAKSLNALSQKKPTNTVTINSSPSIRERHISVAGLADDEFHPPASNQEHALMQDSQRSVSPEKQTEVNRPKYDLFTDAQLAKEVRAYGFKPIKKRATMIELLNQCWDSKNKLAAANGTQAGPVTSTASSKRRATSPTASLPAASRPRGRPGKDSLTASTCNASTTAPAQALSPKRPRGRPRKDSLTTSPGPPSSPQALSPSKGRGRPRKNSASNVGEKPGASAKPSLPAISTPKRRRKTSRDVIEIADSESELSPMPSPAEVNVFSSPEAAVDMSISEDTEISLAVSPTDQQTQLFGFITKAVRSTPPTKDPQNPSWHEKMLMYDPIILEDLAAWLNAGQLDRVGYDGEVCPNDVKKWCESKSICCLWKVNLRGKERKRF